MNARVERILDKLSREHVPTLQQLTPPPRMERWRMLADGLARNGVLVIMGTPPNEHRNDHIQGWVSAYGGLYYTLAETLFPSFAQFRAVYADREQPPVIVLHGECAAVMQVIGGYATPFVVIRQNDHLVSEAELRGVMTFMLEELEAQDLPRDAYNRLWKVGVVHLRNLLAVDVHQYSLTSFARPLFNQLQVQHKRPPVLPEFEQDQAPLTETAQMFRVSIPTEQDSTTDRPTPPTVDEAPARNGRRPPVQLPPRPRRGN